MLIDFTVSNFLSFSDEETFSLGAGKARKFHERIYNDKKVKLTKCEVIFGANASGKSNLISAFQFVQNMIRSGLPRGFSNKYFRLSPSFKDKPSIFRIKLLCDSQIYTYQFSIVLSAGRIVSEQLYENTGNSKRFLYERNTNSQQFTVGPYFRDLNVITKLKNYGEDSVTDEDVLFLSLICKNKDKMFADYPDLQILRKIFDWFVNKLNISFPSSILTGYPYFIDSNLEEITCLLNALGTGISDVKIVELPLEVVQNRIPPDVFNQIITNLEKANARERDEDGDNPGIMLRSYKEFYTFDIDKNNVVTIKTIEFSHEKPGIYFDLNEESDGTARLLDLIEIFFKVSQNRIFIIDEIDRCLHPAMTVKLIELFLEMAKTRNTQLIITSHESRLLASEILRNDEICFVTKNQDGASVINPLEKYQLRADKKVYAALFDGTIDVIPEFNNSKLNDFINIQSQ